MTIIAGALRVFYNPDSIFAEENARAILSRLANAERPMLVVFMENTK